MKKLLLIVNPTAGKTRSHGPLFDAVSVFCKAGYLVHVHNTTGRGDATHVAATQSGDYDVVVCCGGDGTLNETVSGLLQLDNPPPLGYIPRGSTNDFAATLGLSTNPVQAAEDIVTRPPQMLDIGFWNQRPFVYVASFGAFTRSSYAAPQANKNALGHLAYVLEGIKDLNTLRPYKMSLTADGEVLNGEYLFGAICNSTSIGGLMKLDPSRVVLDDGLFEMLLIPNPKTPVELQNLLLALLNQQYDAQGLIFRHISSVTVEPAEDLPWSLDGEYGPGSQQVEIVNHRAALRFLL